MEFGSVESIGNKIGKLAMRRIGAGDGGIFRTCEKMGDKPRAKASYRFVAVKGICTGITGKCGS
jgi:hypothetical protein